MRAADISIAVQSVGKVFDPREREAIMSPRMTTFFGVAICVVFVWFAFVWKIRPYDSVIIGYLDQGSKLVIWGAAVWVVILLLVRRRLRWPFVLFSTYLVWTYLGAFLHGEHTTFILTGVALIAVTFFLFSHSARNPSKIFLVFVVGYLVAGIVFALFRTESAFRTDHGAYSDFLGALPYGLFMGIAPHPNHFGPAMALGLMIIFAQFHTSLAEKILAGVIAVALISSGSDGTYVSIAIALVVMVFVKDYATRQKGVVPWNSVTTGILLFFGGVWAARLIYANGIGGFTTGRDRLWGSLWEPALNAGWLGLGRFPSYIRRYPELFNEVAVRDPNPHNVWLSSSLTAGYIGVLLLLGFWIAVAIVLWRMPAGVAKNLAVGLAVFLFVHGMVETHIFGSFRIYYVLYAVLIGVLAKDDWSQSMRAVPGKQGSRVVAG